MTERISLVTGIGGQDGTLCSSALLDRGDIVLGLSLSKKISQTSPLNLFINFTSLDTYLLSFTRLVEQYKPKSVFNFAGISSSLKVNEISSHVAYSNLYLPLSLMEAYFSLMPDGRFFQASSSYVFPRSKSPITEDTTKNADSIYGNIKNIVDISCESLRQNGHFAVNAYLFSHESYLRPPHSLSKRLLKATREATPNNPLVLDQWNRLNDWSTAESVVDLALKSLESDMPTDYVVGSGRVVNVYDYASAICLLLGKDPRDVLVKGSEDEQNNFRLSNPAKAQNLLGWEPTQNIQQVANQLIK